MLFSKKIIRILVIISMGGAALLPSASFAMEASGGTRGMKRSRPIEPETLYTDQQIETNPSISFALFPYEILHNIYRENLPPDYWCRAREVCTHWNFTFNHPNFWKSIAGWQFSSSRIENGKKALEIIKTLLPMSPLLMHDFNYPEGTILTTLPCESFNMAPTTEPLRNFYLYELFKAQGHIDKSFHYLTKARNQGHPKALWKHVKEFYSIGKPLPKKNKSCTATALQEKPKDIWRHLNEVYSFTDNSLATKACLDAALGGETKAQNKLLQIIISRLGLNHTPNKLDIETYKILFSIKEENVLNINTHFPLMFNKCVELADIWASGREDLLRSAIPIKQCRAFIPPTLLTQLCNIGEGNAGELFFTHNDGKFSIVPIHVKWPEAFFLLGKHFLGLSNSQRGQVKINNYKQAYSYFKTAYPVGGKESTTLLANTLSYTKDSLSILEVMQKDFPIPSETVLTKLADIMLNEIPANVPELQVQGFICFVKDAYQQLVSTGRPPHSTARNFIDHLGNHMKQKRMPEYLDIKILFLDWFRTIPQYTYRPWMHSIIGEYLSEKWGFQLCSDGKFLKNAKLEDWNSRDTEYALEYFRLRTGQHFHLFVVKNFHEALMGIALEKKENETFVRSFKEYCASYINEELNKTKYHILRIKLNKFFKLSPGNAELPLIFGNFLQKRNNWKAEANTYFKIAAENGSQKAIEHFQTAANTGSEEAKNFLVCLAAKQSNKLETENIKPSMVPPSKSQNPKKRQKTRDPDEMDEV